MLGNLLVSLIALILIFIAFEIFFRIHFGGQIRYDYVGDLWVLKPSQIGFTYANNKPASINSEGFRGPSIDEKKPTILLLGDSFTFGYAIGDNDTLAINLARELGFVYNVANGGVPGYGVSQMISSYSLKFAPYKPKLVIICLIEGDIIRQTGAQSDGLLSRILSKSSFVAFIRSRIEALKQKNLETDYDSYLEKDLERLKSFEKSLNSQGIGLIVYPWVYKENQTEFYYKVSQSFQVLPNYFSDIVKEFPEDKKSLYAEDGHPSEIFTRKLAFAMAKDLVQKI